LALKHEALAVYESSPGSGSGNLRLFSGSLWI